jgi:hypothetical protein
MKMNKSRLCASLIAAAVLLGAQAPTAVKATTYTTYDVTLTAVHGPESGSGSFTIATPSPGSGGILTQGSGLTAMSFMIDGVTFGLDSSSEVAYFYSGSALVLAGLVYGGQVGADTLFSITLGTTGAYSFTDSAKTGLDTIGSVSVSATPLPTSLPLLATGLGVLAMIGWWRKRKVGSYLAA